MKNKILITGASSGVGDALVKYFANDYEVIALARNVEEILNHKNVVKYKVDLEDTDKLTNVLEEIVNKYEYIPYLINNAGVMHQAMVSDLKLNDLEYSIRVNALAPMQIMQALLPAMKQNSFGRIVNLTSGAPLNCFQGYAAYSASKAALNAISLTAAKEYSEHNIFINLMSPGPCKTKMAPNGVMNPNVCIPTVDYLFSKENIDLSNVLYWLGYEIPLSPNLEGIQWLEGQADERYKYVL